MLTPESSEGTGRSRLQLEVMPISVSPDGATAGDFARGQQHTTPAKNYQNLHFNSQQYCTPSSHAHHLHLRHHVSSSLCGTPPNVVPISGGLRITPRGVPRCIHARTLTTPNSSASSSGGSRGGMASGLSLISTPNDILYNPFEMDPETMKGWILSPGMFATKSDSEKGASPFWSIDHIAMMKPVDIDERGVQSTRLMRTADPEMEERAQRAIDQFFTTNDLILPSPWSEDNSNKRAFQCPQTPVTPGVVQMTRNEAISVPTTVNENSKDVSCQTALTLPMDVDLQKILGKYYTHEAPKEDGSPDPLSTSSLRRKLFFHGEESAPPSPVQDMTSHRASTPHDRGLSMDDAIPALSDLCSTPDSTKHSSHHTPNSNLLSSSPIPSDSDHGAQTPSLRRCSTAPDLMGSPALSPIRSSQIRVNRRSASKDCGYTSDATPLCEPLQATPSSGQVSLPFTSPGVSPIRLEISFCNAMDGTAQDQRCRLDSPTATTKSTHLRLSSPESPSIAKSPRPSPRLLFPASTDSLSSSGDKAMEVDCCYSFSKEEEPDAFCSSEGFRVLRGFTGFSDSAADPSDDQGPLHPAHSTQVGAVTGVGQDTGYQTNSLQSMNQQDIMGCHTNLTNQFGNLLPLSSRGETELEEGYMSTSMDFINHSGDRTNLFSSTRLPCSQPNLEDPMCENTDLRFPPTKQKLVIKHDCGDNLMGKSCSLDESLILRQARKVLGRPEMDARQEDIRVDYADVYASEIQSHWTVTVPTPLRRKLHQVGLIDSPGTDGTNQVLPSSVALKALQRAGQDVETYCQPRASRPNTLNPSKPSVVFKEILLPDFTDPIYDDAAHNS